MVGTAYDVYEIGSMLGGSTRAYVSMATKATLTGTDVHAGRVRTSSRTARGRRSREGEGRPHLFTEARRRSRKAKATRVAPVAHPPAVGAAGIQSASATPPKASRAARTAKSGMPYRNTKGR